MISPDAGNMGVKAVYVWAGLLVPTTILLWLYYPEVCRLCIPSITCVDASQTYGRTYLELDELYERKIPAWKFRNTATLSDQSGHKNKTLISRQAKRASVAETRASVFAARASISA
jgi:SP family general alpha glucoside:H+ symporter-like MFS transporter